jgi:hypothetical protein
MASEQCIQHEYNRLAECITCGEAKNCVCQCETDSDIVGQCVKCKGRVCKECVEYCEACTEDESDKCTSTKDMLLCDNCKPQCKECDKSMCSGTYRACSLLECKNVYCEDCSDEVIITCTKCLRKCCNKCINICGMELDMDCSNWVCKSCSVTCEHCLTSVCMECGSVNRKTTTVCKRCTIRYCSFYN